MIEFILARKEITLKCLNRNISFLIRNVLNIAQRCQSGGEPVHYQLK